MASPTIPAANTQAVQPAGGSTIPFTVQWYNFFASLVTGPLGPTALVGIITGGAAAAGIVGEYLKSIVPVSPGVLLSNGVDTTVTSLTLTAGDWDLWAELDVGGTGGGGTGTGFTVIAAALWTTAANTSPAQTAYPADGAAGVAACILAQPTHSFGPTVFLGPIVVNITTNTTFFLSGNVTITSPTANVGGAIRARRRR